MDYEKKYKEALEKARNIVNSINVGLIGKDSFEVVFPELAESEDEKIRKDIVFYIAAHHKDDGEKARWLYWLEKQGLKFKVGDLIINKDGNGKVKQILEATNSGYTTNDGFAIREIYEKNYRTCEIKDICQWKPSDEQLKALQGVYDWYMSHYPQNKEFESLFDDLLKL